MCCCNGQVPDDAMCLSEPQMLQLRGAVAMRRIVDESGEGFDADPEFGYSQKAILATKRFHYF